MSEAGPSVPAGYRILSIEETDSTNADAMRRVQEGDPGRLWLTATSQTKGRGRSGRQWSSDQGNLFASLLLRPDCPLETALQLSLLAGVAVFDTVRDLSSGFSGDDVLALKWPNDVLVGRRKIAGILIESAGVMSPDRYAVVIGVGLNVLHSPKGATSLKAFGIDVTASDALSVLASRMDDWLSIWQNGSGFSQIRGAWQVRAFDVGRSISVKLGGHIEEGRYGGIDEGGALRLLRPEGEMRITTGDVFLT